MRTKESLDRETLDRQERTWVYMLHQQAPPPTRHADAAPSGFIPLAPMNSHAPSPLVAARAAAASLALHVNPNANASSATWAAASSQPSPLPSVRPSAAENASVFGGMVKLEKQRATPTSQKPQPPHPSSFVFRSIISKPSVPEAPSDSAHVHRATAPPVNGLMEMLPKRAREEDYAEDSSYQRRAGDEEDYDDETGDHSRGGKRACLPKKCDFPMCKNSSRSRGFCYSHGGGRRCRVDNCANGAVSRDLCKRHGGGRRCRVAGCKSSSESGGLCYSHGGGRRCNLGWCNARAKKGGYCAAHVDNRNALPPVDVLENERDETEGSEPAKAPVKIAAKPVESVNPQVIETLLSLSKSPSHSETEDEVGDASPTDMLSPRLANPYAIASILN